MSWLRNVVTGTFVGSIPDDSGTYLDLTKLRQASGAPLWEEVGPQQVVTALRPSYPAITDPSQVQAMAVIVPAIAANAATFLEKMGEMDRPGTIVRAVYIPVAQVVGQATNYRTLNVLNGGAAGAGTTNMAGLALSSGAVVLNANVENVITLNGTQANLVANDNDSIQWQSALTGTGLADPGGVAVATFSLAA